MHVQWVFSLVGPGLATSSCQANSHAKCGWQTFTDAVIKALNEKREGKYYASALRSSLGLESLGRCGLSAMGQLRTEEGTSELQKLFGESPGEDRGRNLRLLEHSDALRI